MNKPFYISSKPVGSICNLDCKYCYYLEKTNLYPQDEKHFMTIDLLESYVESYIKASSTEEVIFTWHGGEPLLQKIEFYQKAVEFQQKYGAIYRRRISNSLQTNGTIMNDEWASFFAQHHFLIGISLDGPGILHDHYRTTKNGKPTFNEVMTGLHFLKKHKVDYNILATVNSFNVKRPLEVYEFFKAIDARYIQFTPIVERKIHNTNPKNDIQLASPSISNNEATVTEWSVDALEYGEFLIAIFDEWVKEDVGEFFVTNFDAMLANWYGAEPPTCVFAKKCGHAVAMEYNGDVYSCDHYVFSDYKLGNIKNSTLETLLNLPEQIQFGNDKKDKLPRQCKECDFLFACNGECPKNRFMKTEDGEDHLNYLCSGFQKFYHHIDEDMKFMVGELRANRAPSNIIKQKQLI